MRENCDGRRTALMPTTIADPSDAACYPPVSFLRAWSRRWCGPALLLRRFAQQILPAARGPVELAGRLGFDLSAFRAPRQIGRLRTGWWAAVSRGEITPAEGLIVVRRP